MKPSLRARALSPMELAGLQRLSGTGALDIALGIPPGDPPAAVVDAAVSALRDGLHQYADPAGLPELRALIAEDARRTHGVDVDPETEVTVTVGATEGLLTALLAVTDPGDEVLLPEPYFELYPGIVELAGAVPRPVRLEAPGWRLTETAVTRALSPRTRAVVLNTPHNPTGRVFDPGELRLLMDICAAQGIVCVTDEVYDCTVFDGRRHLSPLAMPAARPDTIVVGSLSKKLQMTGWRIGYCIADPETTSVLRTIHEHTTVGTNHPLQAGARALKPSDVLDGRREFQEQRDELVAGLSSLGFTVRPPEGGWFVFAGTEALGRSAREISRTLAARAGVLVAPGTPFFGRPEDGDRWIRTTFVRGAETTRAALDRMAAHLP
ncbi:pyridoxal phosphate-dependent aminotransferase [Streptomyces parvulus]|uniref:pyridoxal phosphate-dependent aminotransferase n=1 Tax=Streptomyces parvulus TaxID=146923 RepID=UPI001E4A2771|nr:pyridoxal phosphate-dependent aminotransferase [Streptomyces parvulus]MCC9152669.1 pyridoxal phosphate-dependent aminotransferase [Streptomyces parvulus]MCE7687183.1 pyridoxal phosphate-dependent aminotransferase [Streptomyces parvulus]